MSNAPSPHSQPTTAELLANWEDLFSALKGATPSSPDWFGIIDIAVGVLVSERVDALRAALNTGEGE